MKPLLDNKCDPEYLLQVIGELRAENEQQKEISVEFAAEVFELKVLLREVREHFADGYYPDILQRIDAVLGEKKD